MVVDTAVARSRGGDWCVAGTGLAAPCHTAAASMTSGLCRLLTGCSGANLGCLVSLITCVHLIDSLHVFLHTAVVGAALGLLATHSLVTLLAAYARVLKHTTTIENSQNIAEICRQ